MPNVTVRPILEATRKGGSPSVVGARCTDTYATATWPSPDLLRVVVDGGAAIIDARVTDPTTIGALIVDRIHVQMDSTLHGMAVSRVNRLLEGAGVPKVEWYHRTGKVVLRAPGKALPLPLTGTAALSAEGTWSFKVSGRVASAAVKVGARTVVTPETPADAPMDASTEVVLAAAGAAKRAEHDLVTASRKREAKLSTTATVKVDVVMPTMADPLGIFKFPVVDPDTAISVDPTNMLKLEACLKDQRAGHREVVALFGPTGSGKTSLVKHLAALNGVGVYTFDAAGATTFIDWAGSTGVVIKDGVSVTEYQPSALIEALRADGPYAGQLRFILIDEVNRVESGAATNFLMALTHDQGGIYIPDARRTIPIDPAAMVFYTGNIGSAYNATIPLDAALVDRIDATIPVDYLGESAEEKVVAQRWPTLSPSMVHALVFAARQTRSIADRGEFANNGVGISTRRILAAARKVAGGLRPMLAAEMCWLESYSGEGGSSSDKHVARVAVEAVLRGL